MKRWTSTWRWVLGSVLAAVACACGPSDDGDDVVECEANLLAGDLVITEIMANPDGDDEGNEWFEIYNATTAALDLTGLNLIESKVDLTGESRYAMTQMIIEPSAYLVLGGVATEFKPDFVDYGYGDGLDGIANTAGRLALQCGSVEVDEVIYGETTSGRSLGLDGTITPDYTANDDMTNWCDATVEYAPNSYGSPGEQNEACGNVTPTQCNDGGALREIVPPTAGNLVINEYMASPDAVADSDGEWLEILVKADMDLNGLQLGRIPDPATGTTQLEQTLASTDCLHVTAGSYVVLVRNTTVAENGGVAADFQLDFGLVGDDDGIYIGYDGNVLDEVTYISSRPNGASTSLDPDFANPTDNDQEIYWCDGVTAYGDGDKGTPGSANEQCEIQPPEGQCYDGDTLRDIVEPTTGQLIINEYLARPAAVGAADGEWLELRATADFDLNGLELGQAESTGPKSVAQTLTSSQCIAVTADTYIVFARNIDTATNGGIPQVDYQMDFGLTDNDDGVFIGLDGAVLDLQSWASSPSGKARSLDYPDGDVWCDAVDQYGDGDYGTPGSQNPACP